MKWWVDHLNQSCLSIGLLRDVLYRANILGHLLWLNKIWYILLWSMFRGRREGWKCQSCTVNWSSALWGERPQIGFFNTIHQLPLASVKLTRHQSDQSKQVTFEEKSHDTSSLPFCQHISGFTSNDKLHWVCFVTARTTSATRWQRTRQ